MALPKKTDAPAHLLSTANSPVEFVVLCCPLLPVRELRLTEVTKPAPRQTDSNVRPQINLGSLATKGMPSAPNCPGSCWAEPGHVRLGLGDRMLAKVSEVGVGGAEQRGFRMQ